MPLLSPCKEGFRLSSSDQNGTVQHAEVESYEIKELGMDKSPKKPMNTLKIAEKEPTLTKDRVCSFFYFFRKITNKKNLTKKRSFLLVELLISLVLLSICFVPIVNSMNSVSTYKAKQIHILEQRIEVKKIFCELKELLHKQAYEEKATSLMKAFKGKIPQVSIGTHTYIGEYALKEEKTVRVKGARLVSIQLNLKNQKESLGPFFHSVLILKEKRE